MVCNSLTPRVFSATLLNSIEDPSGDKIGSEVVLGESVQPFSSY
jgi:hypothetical protein